MTQISRGEGQAEQMTFIPMQTSGERQEPVPDSSFTRQQTDLVEGSLGTVYNIAARIIPRFHPEFEEHVGDGLYGLCQAALSFDPDQGTTFTTYATQRVHGAIIDGYRQRNAVRRSTGEPTAISLLNGSGTNSLSMHTPSDEGSTLDPAAEFVLEEDVVTQILATRILAESLPDGMLLTSREKLVLIGRYGGKTLSEIGESIGVTESRVCQLWTSTCKKLREKYEF